MRLSDSSIYVADLRRAARASLNIDALKGASVLITGAGGLIGSFMVDTLVRYNIDTGADIKIYATGRSIERLSERFDGEEYKCVTFVKYDVNEPIDFNYKADYVIHAASNAYPAAFDKDPVGTITGNIIGTKSLLDYCRTVSARRFLFISSGEVYGQAESTVESFDEDYSGYVNPVNPRSCYPASKRAAENMCVAYTKQYGVDTVIVRPCHTYGASATGNDNRANVQFVNNALRGEDIVMKSAGTQMRSYAYVADSVSAILSVLVNGDTGAAYNIANPDVTVTIAGFAQCVADNAGTKLIFANPDETAIAQRSPVTRQVLDTSKLQALGWKGSYSLEEGVKNTLEILGTL